MILTLKAFLLEYNKEISIDVYVMHGFIAFDITQDFVTVPPLYIIEFSSFLFMALDIVCENISVGIGKRSDIFIHGFICQRFN